MSNILWYLHVSSLLFGFSVLMLQSSVLRYLQGSMLQSVWKIGPHSALSRGAQYSETITCQMSSNFK